MKAALIIATVALGLVGCSTTHEQGGTGPSYEAVTNEGKSEHFENDFETKDPEGAFHNWRNGGDSDIIGPRSPVNPHRPQVAQPIIPPQPVP